MAEITQKDIEYLFQEEVLSQHGEYLIDLLVETLQEKNIRVTDELMDVLNYTNFKEGINRGLRVNFFTYGRFIEIRKHKKRGRNLMDTNTNSLLWGIKENRTKPRSKDTDWYSKNAYGTLNRLISVLMYELSDQEVARIKGILENRINISV
jgi:adenylate cyclase